MGSLADRLGSSKGDGLNTAAMLQVQVEDDFVRNDKRSKRRDKSDIDEKPRGRVLKSEANY